MRWACSFVLDRVILETDHILNPPILNLNKITPKQYLIPFNNSLQHLSIIRIRNRNQMHTKILVIEFGRVLQFYEFVRFEIFLLYIYYNVYGCTFGELVFLFVCSLQIQNFMIQFSDEKLRFFEAVIRDVVDTVLECGFMVHIEY